MRGRVEGGEERGTESKDGSREGDMKAGQEDGVQKEGIEVCVRTLPAS